MNIKELINKILFYVSVPKCVCCKERLDYGARGLCNKCAAIYEAHKQRNCPRCAKILSRCFCSYEHLEAHGIKHLIKLFRYSKAEQSMPSNYLIYSLKQDNRDDVLSFLAEELSEAMKASMDLSDTSKYVISNVPRRKKAIVNFGYDHAKALAVEVSKRLSVEYVELLKSKSKKSQKSVYGHERMENARFDYKCHSELSLKWKTLILIDDIVTTGASMSNCATLIKALKPKGIVGACLGTAYKEKYIEFERSAFK